MKAVCPTCGTHGSVQLFLTDAESRAAAAMLAGISAELAPLLLQYLALFRPKSRALTWSRALRLLREIEQPIASGYVRRHGRDWAAPVSAWVCAINDVLSRREKLDLPLNDHAYLLEIIASKQNKAESAAEQRDESERRVASSQRHSSGAQPLAAAVAAPQDTTPAGRATLALAAEMARRRNAGEPPLSPAESRRWLRDEEARIRNEGAQP